MHAGLMSGRFVRIDINVLESPGPDADRASNAAVITTLPHPFVGHVDQTQKASDWGDGGIRWTEPVLAQRSTNIPSVSPDGSISASTAECALAPMGDPRAYIPLEIGSTMASVVYGHLMRSRAVARWPYGSTTLTILADAQKFAYGQVDLFTH